MRSALALLAFISIAVAALDVRPLLSVPANPDAQWSSYPDFLKAIRSRTRAGDSIAILVPARRGTIDYSYAYYRASYFLAGREVLPVVDAEERIITANVRVAKYLAVWHGRIATNRHVVWRGNGGELLAQ